MWEASPCHNRANSFVRIMHCTVVYPLDLYPAFFGYYFFNFMMAVLQSLHIFWAYLIIRMAQKFITGKARQGSGGGSQPSCCRAVLLQGLDLNLACAAWDEGNGVGLPRVKRWRLGVALLDLDPKPGS